MCSKKRKKKKNNILIFDRQNLIHIIWCTTFWYTTFHFTYSFNLRVFFMHYIFSELIFFKLTACLFVRFKICITLFDLWLIFWIRINTILLYINNMCVPISFKISHQPHRKKNITITTLFLAGLKRRLFHIHWYLLFIDI